MKRITQTLLALAVASFTLPAFAQDVTIDPAKVTLGKAEYSPYLDHGYPDRVYFGDTHVHTSFSTDAGMFGTRLGPEEAYRFALGEEVTSSTGVRARLRRPLDFLVVADHAETMKGMCGGEVMPDFCRAVRVHGSDDGHRPFLRNLRRTNGETRPLRVVSVR